MADRLRERLRDRRPQILVGIDGRRERELDSGHVITSAPSYALFIQQYWNGRWTAIPIEPADVDALTRALTTEARHASGLPARRSVDPDGARLYRDERPWDIAQGYALAFGFLATGQDVGELKDAEERITAFDPLDPSTPPNVRAIAIDALARAQDRARERQHG